MKEQLSVSALDQAVRAQVDDFVLDWLEPRIRGIREQVTAIAAHLPLPAEALPLIRDTLSAGQWRAWHEIRRQIPAPVPDEWVQEGLALLVTLGVVRQHRLSTGAVQYRLAFPAPAAAPPAPAANAAPSRSTLLEPLKAYFLVHPDAVMTRQEIQETVLTRAVSSLTLSRGLREACDAGILEPAGVRRMGKGGRPARCYRAGALVRRTAADASSVPTVTGG